MIESAKEQEQEQEKESVCTYNRKFPGVFSTRQDVINKSLIRAVKKHYNEEFVPSKNVIYTLKNQESTNSLKAIDEVRIL